MTTIQVSDNYIVHDIGFGNVLHLAWYELDIGNVVFWKTNNNGWKCKVENKQ